MISLRMLFFICFLCANTLGSLRAQEIRVAAAADLKFALDDIAADFNKLTGVIIAPTYGSSGNFFMQIQSGAPFDIFLSADVDYPHKLGSAGFADPGTLQQFATGRIVLWMRQDSSLDLPRLQWNALLDPAVKKIAIANPEHAPYGRAALAALRQAGIYDQVRSKFVFGENISQAAQFVQSGNADVGIIALSLALSPVMKSGKRWDIPPDTYPKIAQAAVILKQSTHKQAASAFLEFLRTEAAHKILQRYGFDAPAPAISPNRP